VADAEHHTRQSIRVRLDRAEPARIAAIIADLTRAGTQRLSQDGFPVERQIFQRAAAARYAGQSSEIEVALPDGDIPPMLIADLFAAEHEKTYGFRAPAGEPVELMGLSVMARGLPEQPRLPERIPPFAQPVPASRRAWFSGIGWVDTPVTDRAGLTGTVAGPLIVQEYDATCLVPKGMTARVDAFGNVRVEAE
jgi:N-methylhydantoinase A